MNLTKIESFLDSPDPQSRMQAITELRQYEPAVVVPLLKRRMYDRQFLIRSFVAMGLGYKRNEDAFRALIDMIERETDPNVIAEAANSLSKFGPEAIPYLADLFEQNPHWLIRQSIFATFDDLDAPDVLLQCCHLGFDGDDLTVKLAAVSNLARLKDTCKSSEAMDLLLQAAADSSGLIRSRAARVIRFFGGPVAQSTLAKLRDDSDERVVKAVLEGLFQQ